MGKTNIDRFGDTSLRYITLGDSDCNRCLHIHMGGDKCRAFPDGIPIEILNGGEKHTKPYKGDNGIRFEPIGV